MKVTATNAEESAAVSLPDPRLYNADLAPTTPAQRTWGTYNYIALWFSMSMEVTTYMLASSLIAGGMNWWQAVLTILLGNLIVLIPMLLNAHAGASTASPSPSSSAPASAPAEPTSPPCSAPSSPAAGSASSPGSAASPSPP